MRPLSDFGNEKARYDGCSPYCKPCTRSKALAWKESNLERRREIGRAHYHKYAERYRDKALERKFGITRQQYDEILERQGGVCAICQQPQHEPGRNLHVDHCHETDRVRGLLCGNCNRGVGLFKDNAERLRAAAEYLESD